MKKIITFLTSPSDCPMFLSARRSLGFKDAEFIIGNGTEPHSLDLRKSKAFLTSYLHGPVRRSCTYNPGKPRMRNRRYRKLDYQSDGTVITSGSARQPGATGVAITAKTLSIHGPHVGSETLRTMPNDGMC